MKVFRAARLETEPHQTAFNILRKLYDKIGHLRKSYLLSGEFDLSGLTRTSGGFADIWSGEFRGETVLINPLGIAGVDDKVGNQTTSSHRSRATQHFCKVSVFQNGNRQAGLKHD